MSSKGKRHTNPDGTEGGFVEDAVAIAADVFVDPTASIYSGSRQTVICHRAIIGENVRIEPGVYVGAQAIIGDDSRIQAGARISQGQVVPANSIITAADTSEKM